MIWLAISISAILIIALIAYWLHNAPLVTGCTYCERQINGCNDCPPNSDYETPTVRTVRHVNHDLRRRIMLMNALDAATAELQEVRSEYASQGRPEAHRVADVLGEVAPVLTSEKISLGYVEARRE